MYLNVKSYSLENIKQLFSVGAFVPLTKDGNLVVDGILASCYIEVNHDLAHLTMMPMQWLPNMLKWICGEDEGFPVFVNMAKQFSTFMLPSGQFCY